MPAEQHKPRFEPPPWEREAFERFQQERSEARVSEELDEALRHVRQAEREPVPNAKATRQAQHPADAEQLPEVKIDAMLVQLRAEEPSIKPASGKLIDATVGFLVLTGLAIIVQAAVLFADARSDNAALNMFAGTLSFVLFLTGAGFFVGATLLFRKYHH